MLSADGRCYAFDSRGDGYARGEGVSTIILKRLDQAIADGDQIHAVIMNSGVNQDGKTPGITVPSGEAQTSLMKSVYAKAGLNPAETLYVEAHGTVCARYLMVIELVYRIC
jgi:acyl transferase domain-containing protein